MNRVRLPPCLPRRRIYDGRVPLTGDYEPSSRKWVRDQVERYEATDGREANTLAGTSRPIVIFTTRGRKSRKIRKFALMRVEHDGKYAMVGSMGGAPKHPEWYLNLKADPDALMVQDGADRFAPPPASCRVMSARSGGNGRSRPTRRMRTIRRRPTGEFPCSWPSAASNLELLAQCSIARSTREDRAWCCRLPRSLADEERVCSSVVQDSGARSWARGVPPTSSSLAEERTSLLASPQHGGARFPDARSP